MPGWRPQGLWRNPEFVKLWSGRTISELCSRITREGLPLMAALLLGATPWDMALLAAMGAVPVLLVGLLAGVWVDRTRRRPILIAADVGRALLLLSIPAAALLGVLHMPQLYVVAALTGVLTVFFNVADQSFLPVLVTREHLVEGNSKLEASAGLAEVGGPVLAGLLVQAFTAPIAILVDALSFLVSAGTVVAIRTPEPPPAPVAPHTRWWDDVALGLRLVLGHPILRAIAANNSIGSFFGGFYATLYVLYCIRVVGLTPALLGICIAAGGVGVLLGTLVAGPLGRRFGLGRVLVGSTVAGLALSFFTPLAGGLPLGVAMALLFTSQLCGDLLDEVFFIHAVSLRQRLTPDALLGRVNGSMHFLADGIHPFGILAGGALGGLIGVQQTLWVAVLGNVLAAVLIVASPIRRLEGAPPPLTLDGLIAES